MRGDDPSMDPEEGRKLWMAGVVTIKSLTAERRSAGQRADPRPFLCRMDEHPDGEAVWKIYEGFMNRSGPLAVSNFMQSFVSCNVSRSSNRTGNFCLRLFALTTKRTAKRLKSKRTPPIL